jgi:peptidyl-prolyl cis-trans isomerase B (cyclophilin B)
MLMNIKKIVALLISLALLLPILTACTDDVGPLGDGWCEYAADRDLEGREIHYVEMGVRGYGKVIILLDATTAPKTVKNFLTLVRSGFYNGLTFHRVIEDFMIQGGDPKGDGSGGSPNNVVGEFVLNGHYNDISHLRGVISMARSDSYNSASSQFFICNADAIRSLDGRYAAFGYVIMGMSVIDAITEDVFPKTAYADYRGVYEYYGSTGMTYHGIWNNYGNGRIESAKDKPVIDYIKELVDYVPEFSYE